MGADGVEVFLHNGKHGFFLLGSVVLAIIGVEPNIPHALEACAKHGLTIDLDRTSYYLGRETLLPTGKSKMWRWRKMLFSFISKNARPATAYFNLPPNRVVELGMQIDF